MRLALAMLLLVVSAFAAGAAQTAASTQAIPSTAMSDFERNVTLGAILETRPGTQVEIEELRRLAERGLAAARAAVANSPTSPEAHYALGSWLLYGYRVVSREEMVMEQGGVRRTVVDKVVQGLSDDPTEGLQALKKATELAPANTGYLLDYAAGLIDYERGSEAEGMLKIVWGNSAESLQNKRRAGFLLSAIALDKGDLAGAREWVYSALLLDPNLAEAVDRLRYLDAAMQAEMESYYYEWTPEEESEEFSEEGYEEYYEDEDYPAEEVPADEEESAYGGEIEGYYEESPQEGEDSGVTPPAPPSEEEYGVEPPAPPSEEDYGVEPPAPPSGEEEYYEEPYLPEPPAPPAPPTGDAPDEGYGE